MITATLTKDGIFVITACDLKDLEYEYSYSGKVDSLGDVVEGSVKGSLDSSVAEHAASAAVCCLQMVMRNLDGFKKEGQ